MAGNDDRVEVTRCERTPSGDWLFAFACADTDAFQEFVRCVKQGIPASLRKWLPDERCWRITTTGMLHFWQFMPQLREPMQRMAQQTHGQQRQQQRTRQQTRGNVAPIEVAEAFAVLFLLPAAPMPVIKAAYRALANTYHPDHGGTDDQMKRLNKAHEQACAWANKTAGKAG